jgi:hypothetical protein
MGRPILPRQRSVVRAAVRPGHQWTCGRACRRYLWPCPECQQELPPHDTADERVRRHLGACHHQTFLHARVAHSLDAVGEDHLPNARSQASDSFSFSTIAPPPTRIHHGHGSPATGRAKQVIARGYRIGALQKQELARTTRSTFATACSDCTDQPPCPGLCRDRSPIDSRRIAVLGPRAAQRRPSGEERRTSASHW